MPNINIVEKDLTTAGFEASSSNIVYVPGFAGHLNKDYEGITFPYLFNSVSEFKKVFSDDSGNFNLLKVSDTTEFERSQLYTLALLQQGLPVLFDRVDTSASSDSSQSGTTTDISSASSDNYLNWMKTHIAANLKKLEDRNNYDIKFITSGGYYDSSFGKSLISVAKDRGDCTALIDHAWSTSAIKISDYLTSEDEKSKYAAMFTPWCIFKFPIWDATNTTPIISMPGSLAYLLAFAQSTVTNNNSNWLAAAGASRGTIPYLASPLVTLSEDDIKSYQADTEVSINPIANINPYGYIVWGNRTLNNNASSGGLVASSFLNIRQLCNDIKKTLYKACKSITFEQNSDLLWVKFKALITPLLDQMQTSDGISGYQITKKKSTKKATLTAVIRIYPIEAVEDFDITLELADESTTVSDNL